MNSAYCNLLQCTHFADTCVAAEEAGRLTGWLSAHRPPSAPEEIFVWQVAVHPEKRGAGLAARMLHHLLQRPAVQSARWLTATITESNTASWALFDGFAGKRSLGVSRSPLFYRDRHFAGAHNTEWQVRVGPLSAAVRDQIKEET